MALKTNLYVYLGCGWKNLGHFVHAHAYNLQTLGLPGNATSSSLQYKNMGVF